MLPMEMIFIKMTLELSLNINILALANGSLIIQTSSTGGKEVPQNISLLYTLSPDLGAAKVY